MQDEISTEESWKIPLRYKVMMIAVALITVLAVWLVPDKEQSTPAPLPDLPTPQQVSRDLPQPAGGDAAAERDGDRARGFFMSLREAGQQADPEAVFEEARRLQDEGHVIDAHVLYRYAARRGHGQAAMLLGTQADPAFYNTEIPATLNNQPEQAYRWYNIASAQGINEADKRLQALRKRVEKSAASGDESAQRLLLLWK